jgi:DHA2 family multidrug resistance protein-like MFS transporter
MAVQYLQSAIGLEPLVAGLWTVPSIVVGIGATLLAPKLVRHVRAGYAVGAGLATAAAGAALLAVSAPHLSLAATVVGYTVLYVGVTPTLALTTDLIVGAAPRERAGMASGVAESGAEFGLAAGMALIGTAAMTVYQDRLHSDAPAELHASTVEEASQTVGSGVAVAEGLPGETGSALLTAVRLAFADGVQTAATISAIVLAIGAYLALRFLPGTNPMTLDDQPPTSRRQAENGTD